METIHSIEREQRTTQREKVALFIKDSLRPTGHVITDPDYEDDFEVREYQLEAWQSLWEARAQGEMSALVTLATGLGTTSVGVFDVMKFQEELREREGRDPRILFVCHQEKILEQAAKRFERFIPDMSRGFYTGEVKDEGQDITFGTFHSLQRNLDQFDPFEYDYVIYDEAHHTQADTWRRVVKHFSPSFQLALTATPDRMDGLEILDLFGREVYAKGLGEALAEGLLADIDYHIVFDEAVKEALEAGFHPKTLKELRELLAVPRRNDVIARNIREEMQRIGAEEAKTIVFCSSIAHADVMAKLLGGKAYHSELKRGEGNDVLAEFRNGDLQIICTIDMFNEGIDIPDANLLVFLRSTQSKTVFEQQLGRGLRKHEGKSQVSVLDFVGNIRRLQEVLDLSNSVSALTSEHDLDDLISEGDRPRIGAINITTSHTNFDFDKLAVDILSTYQALTAEPAPEGYMSVDAFARELGITYSTLKKLIAHHQIETERFKFYSTIGSGLSPEAQEYLRALGGFVEQAPEGYLSAHQFSKEFGMTAPTLLREIKGYDIPVERHRFGANATISFSPDAQQMVRERVSFVKVAPEGYKSVQAFADELGISHKYLSNAIAKHGIETGRHRFGTPPGISLSPEAQEQLKSLDLAGEPKPGGYISVTAYAKQLRTTYQTLAARIQELGIEPSRHSTGFGFAATLSPQDQETIRSTYYPDVEPAPEDYMSLLAYSRVAGISRKTLVKLIENHEIELETVRLESKHVAKALSPEAQAKLNELVNVAPPAPEGYVSVTAFAREIQTAVPRLFNIIEEHGIETAKFRFRTQTVPGLSPEAQARILEIYSQGAPKAPEGYSSLTSFTREAGISLKRLNQIIEEGGIETGEYIFGVSTVGVGLSPEAQRQVLAIRGDFPSVPEGYKSIDTLAKELGTHWNMLTRFIEENSIEAGQFRSPKGNQGIYVSPESQQQLAALVEAHDVPDAPEGYVNTSAFAKQLGVGTATLAQVLEEAGIEAATYKFGKSKARGKALSPEVQERVRRLVETTVVQPAPEGYVSIGAFAKSLNIAPQTLKKLIDKNGIETGNHRFGVSPGRSLSPAAQQALRQLLNS
jgi:superfamily II DNA or RNA helicase